MKDPALHLMRLEHRALDDRTGECEARLRALPGGRRWADEIGSYCRALRDTPLQLPYNRFSGAVISIRDAVQAAGGPALVAAFHRCALLRAVPESWKVLRSRQHLAPALPWFEDAMARAMGDVVTTPDEDLDLVADPFAKDLGVASLRLLALGAVTIEPRLRLPRRWMVQGGTRNLLVGIRTLVGLRGTAPLYEMHAYNRHLAEFTEAGWESMYRRMASIMRQEPEVRGLYGGTWFWDPALETVSPRLAYLRRLPLENGAIFAQIPTVPDTFENALSTSESRRRLHAEGKYLPRQFIMIWPRASFLRWAGSA